MSCCGFGECTISPRGKRYECSVEMVVANDLDYGSYIFEASGSTSNFLGLLVSSLRQKVEHFTPSWLENGGLGFMLWFLTDSSFFEPLWQLWEST